MSELMPVFSYGSRQRAKSNAKVLSVARERELLLRYHATHDREAMEELVNSHMPIILRVARKNALNPGVDLEDLIQTATEGLLVAINRWSFNKSDAAGARAAERDEDDEQTVDPAIVELPPSSSRLVTYAMWWMRTLLNDRVLEGRGMVARTKNRKTRMAFFGLPKAIRALNLQLPLRASDVERIAKYLSIDQHEVREALIHAAGDVMLDEPVGDGQTSRGEITADSKTEGEYGIVERLTTTNTWNAVCAHLMTLRPRDRFVVITRYLLDTKWKLDHLSEVLKMSRERIRQISDCSLADIRRALDASGVNETPARQAAAVEVQAMVDSIERAAASSDPQAISQVMRAYNVLIGPTRGPNLRKELPCSVPPSPTSSLGSALARMSEAVA